jgi:hypothetical protein
MLVKARTESLYKAGIHETRPYMAGLAHEPR